MKKTSFVKNLTVLAAALVLAASLAGCSGSAAESNSSYEPNTKTYTESIAPVIDVPAARGTSAETDLPKSETPFETEAVTAPVETNSRSTEDSIQARIERLKEQEAAKNADVGSSDNNNAVTEAPVVDNASVNTDLGSVQNVARLGTLVGNNALEPADQSDTTSNTTPYIDIDNAHNPYDLTWRYGKMPASECYEQTKSYNWDKLYRSYVSAVDWSLVFDAEYYKDAFPVLAQLYHDNDELLLEHFQTVGVHEGRQGNANFNVAAYMANCDAGLKDTFGDNYECYYFYYMLNQDSQASVKTTGNYRTWQTVELSWYQSDELEHVNAYRAEVDADPVTVDPEMTAFANLRAWNDAVGDVWAHDAIYDGFVDDAMDNLDIGEFFENTVKVHSGSDKFKMLPNPWYEFKISVKGHYEAMVAPTQRYFGSSNSYLSSQSGTKSAAEFDMFTPETPLTSR